MPTTTNYSWTIPTPGGDTGAWGGILNTALSDIDDELRRVEVDHDARLTDLDSRVTTLESGGGTPGTGPVACGDAIIIQAAQMQHLDTGFLILGAHLRYIRGMGLLQWIGDNASGFTTGSVLAPIVACNVGDTIVGFESIGGLTDGTGSVKLCRVDLSTQVHTVISTGHALPTTNTLASTTGISHVVLDNNAYYILINWYGAGAGTLDLVACRVLRG